MNKIKILILAANPSDTDKLELGQELLKLELLRQNSKFKESFELKFELAVQDDDLQRALLDFQPDIVHFCGHGEVDGLFLCNQENKKQFVHAEAISNLFKLFADKVRCVVLNACYTEDQAKMISEHIDYVVGMNKAIGDEAAIKFTTGFYNAVFSGEDFKKAYELACNAIDLANIPEYATPVLQTRRQTFVPSFKHDVFISFADADEKWAADFIVYLTKQLKQKLQTADGFQLYTGNDFSQVEHSATLMVIASPAYCQQYQAQLDVLKQQNKLFFIEKEPCNPRPEALKGFVPTKFWRYDDSEGMMFFNGGDDYFVQADKLANEVANRLLELKKQHQSKQRFEAEHQAETEKTASIEASVFLNSAPEDLQLSQYIKSLLKKNGVKCVLEPMPRTSNLSPQDMRDDIEEKILGCDAVLVLCEQTTAVWASKQIMNCLKLQRKGETSFRIVAVHGGKNHSDLGIDWEKLKTYLCPPQQVESYLQDFIRELA